MESLELTVLDWLLAGGTTFLAVVGLFLGFSGQVALLAGFALASVTGYSLFGVARSCAVLLGWGGEDGAGTIPALVIDAVFTLLAFGLARMLVTRFIRKCLGRFANAILGALVGAVIGLAGIAFLAGAFTGRPVDDGVVEKSAILHTVSAWTGGGR